ncbi:hypothetical protein Tco_1221491 [Tanacetum coccineum]
MSKAEPIPPTSSVTTLDSHDHEGGKKNLIVSHKSRFRRYILSMALDLIIDAIVLSHYEDDANFTNEIICSFFSQQASMPTTHDDEDLLQIDEDSWKKVTIRLAEEPVHFGPSWYLVDFCLVATPKAYDYTRYLPLKASRREKGISKIMLLIDRFGLEQFLDLKNIIPVLGGNMDGSEAVYGTNDGGHVVGLLWREREGKWIGELIAQGLAKRGSRNLLVVLLTILIPLDQLGKLIASQKKKAFCWGYSTSSKVLGERVQAFISAQNTFHGPLTGVKECLPLFYEDQALLDELDEDSSKKMESAFCWITTSWSPPTIVDFGWAEILNLLVESRNS